MAVAPVCPAEEFQEWKLESEIIIEIHEIWHWMFKGKESQPLRPR
jgi:hypothetical protein